MPSQSTMLGAAGEFHVMSQLLRMGYIAAMAPQGVPNTDIVVTDLGGQRLCTIQVKTRRDIGSDRGWHMKAKHEKIIGDRLFYCFVDFGKTPVDHPKIFILPSKMVAKVLTDTHRHWLAKPGKNGRPHKDGEMRRMKPCYVSSYEADCPYSEGWLEKYRDAWSLLELEANETVTEENLAA